MDRRLKLALDIAGILATLASIGLFYTDERFAVALVLSAVTGGLVVASIIHARTPRVTSRSVHWHWRILDGGGLKAIARKDQVLVANQANVDRLVDRNLSGSGELEFIGTNLGRLSEPVDEGGTLAVTTLLDAPLPVGKPIIKVLEVLGTQCFPKPTESVSITVDQRTGEIGVHIEFPIDRPAKRAAGYMHVGGRTVRIEQVDLARDGHRIDALVPAPEHGAKYVVEFDW